MRRFDDGALRIQANLTRSGVELVWRGRSDAREPERSFGSYLKSLAEELGPGRLVELDFRQLDYLNAASVKPILVFLQTIAPAAERVRVRFSAQKSWQRLSFKAMQAVLATRGNVEFEC